MPAHPPAKEWRSFFILTEKPSGSEHARAVEGTHCPCSLDEPFVLFIHRGSPAASDRFVPCSSRPAAATGSIARAHAALGRFDSDLVTLNPRKPQARQCGGPSANADASISAGPGMPGSFPHTKL